jgi:ABC-type metal ion transport system substrate-binding protein
MQIEDIQENDNQHKTDEEEESQTTEMDTCNDLIRIGENYLTQTNYKLEEVQSTQESAQETSSTQEEPAITAVTEKESEYMSRNE